MGILDVIFPKNCLTCGKSGGYLCDKCVGRVNFAKTFCPVCSRFAPYGKTHPACKSDYSLEGLCCIWDYSAIIQTAIKKLKYNFAYEVAKDLAHAMATEVPKFRLPQNIVLTCVPSSKHRENWRGFNHADLVAKFLAEILKKEYLPNLLVKPEDSKQQVKLRKLERARNISGKFAVNKAFLAKISKNTPIAIIDDVWTTGSTMKECCRVLKGEGFAVWGIAIAHRE